MFLENFNTIPEDKIYDFCIIGAGPAGLTLARRFLNTDKEVLIIESGGGPCLKNKYRYKY